MQNQQDFQAGLPVTVQLKAEYYDKWEKWAEIELITRKNKAFYKKL